MVSISVLCISPIQLTSSLFEEDEAGTGNIASVDDTDLVSSYAEDVGTRASNASLECYPPSFPFYKEGTPTKEIFTFNGVMGCILSGLTSKAEEFRTKLPTYSAAHGEVQPCRSTTLILKDGFISVIDGKLITFIRMK